MLSVIVKHREVLPVCRLEKNAEEEGRKGETEEGGGRRGRGEEKMEGRGVWEGEVKERMKGGAKGGGSRSKEEEEDIQSFIIESSWS